MTVKIWFDKSNAPIVHENVQAMYEKGSFLCIAIQGERIKYPIDHIFCTREDVGDNSSQKKPDYEI